MYVVGGIGAAGTPVTSVLAVDAGGDVHRAATLPRPLSDAGVASLPGRLLVIGGSDGAGPTRAVLSISATGGRCVGRILASRHAGPAPPIPRPAPRRPLDRRPREQPHAHDRSGRPHPVALPEPAGTAAPQLRRRRVLHARRALDHLERGGQPRHRRDQLPVGPHRVALRAFGATGVLARLPQHPRRRVQAVERPRHRLGRPQLPAARDPRASRGAFDWKPGIVHPRSAAFARGAERRHAARERPCARVGDQRVVGRRAHARRSAGSRDPRAGGLSVRPAGHASRQHPARGLLPVPAGS